MKITKYTIQKVRRDKDGDIIAVKTLYNIFTTEEVVRMIEEGHKFVVNVSGEEIEVGVVKRESKKYIKTFRDGKKINNLDELPEF
ncbi:MAG: DUF3892 domain-containing protein [Candidatus Heimdallarchaeaceae archaeon]